MGRRGGGQIGIRKQLRSQARAACASCQPYLVRVEQAGQDLGLLHTDPSLAPPFPALLPSASSTDTHGHKSCTQHGSGQSGEGSPGQRGAVQVGWGALSQEAGWEGSPARQ